MLRDKLKWSMLYYPTLYREPDDVLHHLFFVIGNGYEWKNGELVDRRISLPINVERIAARARRGMRAEIRRWKKDFHGLIPTLAIERQLHNYDFTVANIDRIVDSAMWSSGAGYRGLYPYCKEHARINSMPDDVKTDWILGAHLHVISIECGLTGLREPTKVQREYARVLPAIKNRLKAMLMERGEIRAKK